MAVFSIIIVCVLIFPLFLHIYAYFSLEYKKLFFSINLFKVFKVVGGYAETCMDGVIVHLSKNKAVIIPKNSIIGMKKKFKPLKDYHIIKLNTNIEIGIKDGLLTATVIGFTTNYVYKILKWVLFNRKSYLKFNNSINVFESESRFNIFVCCTVVFNLLMILLSLIKILMEKIIYAISNGKQQNN